MTSDRRIRMPKAKRERLLADISVLADRIAVLKREHPELSDEDLRDRLTVASADRFLRAIKLMRARRHRQRVAAGRS